MPSKSTRVAIATIGDQGLEDRVSNHFGHSKTFTIVEVSNGNIKNVKVMRNPAASLSYGRGRVLTQQLVNMGVDIVISGKIGLGASTILDEQGLKKVIAKHGEQVIDVLRKNSLAR